MPPQSLPGNGGEVPFPHPQLPQPQPQLPRFRRIAPRPTDVTRPQSLPGNGGEVPLPRPQLPQPRPQPPRLRPIRPRPTWVTRPQSLPGNGGDPFPQRRPQTPSPPSEYTSPSTDSPSLPGPNGTPGLSRGPSRASASSASTDRETMSAATPGYAPNGIPLPGPWIGVNGSPNNSDDASSEEPLLKRELLEHIDRRIKLASRAYVRELLAASMNDLD